MKQKKYNIDLCKGTGLIQETLLLLNLYVKGMSKNQMTSDAIKSNVLVKASDRRIKDIVEVAFYKRFVNNDPSVPEYLKELIKNSLSLDVIGQLFLIYTSRTNLVLMDFITDVYWPEVKKGTKSLDFTFSRKFISEILRHSETIIGWSEGTQKRVATYIISTLVDFRFLDKQRNVKPVFLNDITANYLAHELHHSGLSDNAVADAIEWKIFGYSRYETIKHLERLSFQGHFILQNSGELLKINWIHKNMEELTHAILK